MLVLEILANGSEEKEAMSIATILKRGGCTLVLAGVGEKEFIKGANGVKIGVDTDVNSVDISEFDAVVLPGGMDGMQNCVNSSTVLQLLKKANDCKKVVAAMCASPIVLDKAGLKMSEFTCYPSLESKIQNSSNYTGKATAISENIITGKGPALSDEFALCILEKLMGPSVRKSVEEQILY